MKSQSCEIGSLNHRIAWKFEVHIGSTAAVVPVKCQSDRSLFALFAAYLHLSAGMFLCLRLKMLCIYLWASRLGQILPRTTHTHYNSYPGQLVLGTRNNSYPRPTQDKPNPSKSYPWQVWHEQLSSDYDNSIEYLSIARNFHQDGRHDLSSPMKLEPNITTSSIWSLQISEVMQSQGLNIFKPLYYASQN